MNAVNGRLRPFAQLTIVHKQKPNLMNNLTPPTSIKVQVILL